MPKHEPELEFIMEYVGGAPSRDPNSYQLWRAAADA